MAYYYVLLPLVNLVISLFVQGEIAPRLLIMMLDDSVIPCGVDNRRGSRGRGSENPWRWGRFWWIHFAIIFTRCPWLAFGWCLVCMLVGDYWSCVYLYQHHRASIGQALRHKTVQSQLTASSLSVGTNCSQIGNRTHVSHEGN